MGPLSLTGGGRPYNPVFNNLCTTVGLHGTLASRKQKKELGMTLLAFVDHTFFEDYVCEN